MADTRNVPHIDMLRSPLGRARGLGSAREGAKHWWAQQLSSIALVPLTLWFIWSLLHLSDASQADVAAWLSSPVRLALMLALIAATFHHLRLGLQVVIEDYVHHEGLKLAAILAVKGACILLGLVCTISALALGLTI
jgi:succinate dehydrogenase / fumarate reductase, membrane anchor subunit